MSGSIITRDDMPYLEVESIEEGPVVPAKDGQPKQRLWRIHGTLSDPSVVDFATWCAFLGPNRSCFYGDWTALPGPNSKVQFETANEPNGVSIGSRLRYAGDLDARAAILIEDGPSAWQEFVFEANDAVATRFVDGDGKLWRELTELEEGQLVERGAEIVSDGWDHEHCLICNAHIDPGDRFYRHHSENEFLCLTCYGKYAATGDLSFLVRSNEATMPPEAK